MIAADPRTDAWWSGERPSAAKWTTDACALMRSSTHAVLARSHATESGVRFCFAGQVDARTMREQARTQPSHSRSHAAYSGVHVAVGEPSTEARVQQQRRALLLAGGAREVKRRLARRRRAVDLRRRRPRGRRHDRAIPPPLSSSVASRVPWLPASSSSLTVDASLSLPVPSAAAGAAAATTAAAGARKGEEGGDKGLGAFDTAVLAGGVEGERPSEAAAPTAAPRCSSDATQLMGPPRTRRTAA